MLLRLETINTDGSIGGLNRTYWTLNFYLLKILMVHAAIKTNEFPEDSYWMILVMFYSADSKLLEKYCILKGSSAVGMFLSNLSHKLNSLLFPSFKSKLKNTSWRIESLESNNYLISSRIYSTKSYEQKFLMRVAFGRIFPANLVWNSP